MRRAIVLEIALLVLAGRVALLVLAWERERPGPRDWVLWLGGSPEGQRRGCGTW